MRRITLLAIGAILAFLILQSCSSKPEEGLLRNYFHAIQLKDIATMSSMALEPVALEFDGWSIAAVAPDKTEPATLPELNKKELELKKLLENHVGPVMDANDALTNAKDELDSARTGAAKAAAKKKVEEMQAKYDQEFALHKQYQTDYNNAKAAAAREEEISQFSLFSSGMQQLPNIRDLKGSVFSKEVDVKLTKAGAAKTYRFHMRRYELKDEAVNVTHRGRWIILNFEPIS